MSADGRPLLGPLPGVEGLFVAAGHGPWGISLGPGSARLVADAVLGRPAIAPELAGGAIRPGRGGWAGAGGAEQEALAVAAAEREQRIALRLVSMPSGTTVRPSEPAIVTTACTSAATRPSVMSATKARSILRPSSGNRCR